jgi:hypothetical protein
MDDPDMDEVDGVVGVGEWGWWRASKKIEMLSLTIVRAIIRQHQTTWPTTRTKSTAAKLK